MKNVILQGDALSKLKELSEKSVNMCMTSPPYWALRDYGVDGQLGLEPTYYQYINNLCDIFDEVHRVLRDDGTCWVNLGDTYYGGGFGKSTDLSKTKQGTNRGTANLETRDKLRGIRKNLDKSIPTKSLTCIPMRFAIEMVNRGWILRNTIIWHKPNVMPSSAKDRFTVDFEYIFLFSKKKKYYFEQQLDPYTSPVDRWGGEDVAAYNGKYSDGVDNENYNSPRARCSRPGYPERARALRPNPNGKNKRTMWSINTKPCKDAHFAVYPEKLCETPIKAGCPVGGSVLDPFAGAFTTGIVANKQNKNAVLIELNPEYIEIGKKRLASIQQELATSFLKEGETCIKCV